MSRVKRIFAQAGVSMAVIVGLNLSLGSSITDALSAIGPDPGELNNSASYVLSDTCDVQGARQMSVPIYFTTYPGNVTVAVTVTAREYGGSMQATNGTGWTGSKTGNFSVSINISSTPDANSGRYVGVFSAKLTSGGPSRCYTPREVYGSSINFKLQLQGNSRGVPQGVIGYSAGNNSTYFAVANAARCDSGSNGDRSGCGKYYDYSLPFAPPCSTPSGKTSITIFDGDNPSGSYPYGIQPSGFMAIVYDSSGRTIASAGPGGTAWSNGHTKTIPFSFTQGGKYKLVLRSIYTNNVLQFHLPFDSIYSEIPCPRYDLVPNVSSTPSVLQEGGGSIHVSPSVGNTSNTTSQTTGWQVTRFYVSPGSTLTLGVNPDIPCRQFSGYRAGGCQVVKSGSRTFPIGTTDLGAFDDAISSTETVGTKICYATSVDKGSSVFQTWKHSQVSCTTIVRVPYVQVLGNDLRVGSGFNIRSNVAAGVGTYVLPNAGSWAEYSVLAPGNVDSFASQSGAASGSTQPQSAWSKLTFANTNVPVLCDSGAGCFAGASEMGTIPNPTSFVKTATVGGSPIDHSQGASSFNATDIPAIVPGASLNNFRGIASVSTTGDITINADITYESGTLSSQNDIPQLILIGRNINITSNVKRVDAWLVASGTINTCSDVAQSALRSGQCANQLAINGPVMASRLLLDRTYYNVAKPTEAAETATLSGGAYIATSRLNQENGTWQTVYSTDLPPRY